MAELRGLIVDDDEKFSVALERALTRFGIQCERADSVPAAVDYLKRSAIDLMILDIRLPEISGLTFLKQLSLRGINVPVVLVSGHARNADKREAFKLGTPLLTKPFRLEQLAAQISVVTGVELAGIDKEVVEGPKPVDRLRRALRRVTRELALGERDLPVLDPRVEEAQALMRGTDPGVEDVLRVVNEDPLLCASLIRAANLTVLSGEKIRTVTKAVVRLGTREALEIVLQALMKQSFDVRRGPYRDLLDRMWRCSLATARVARWLADRSSELDPEEMRLAALVHDAGELLLVCAAADLPMGLRNAVKPREVLDEIALLHESVGELLLDAWRMPRPLPRWAGRHHGPKLAEGPATLQLAWQIAQEYGFSYLPRPDAEPDQALAQTLRDQRIRERDVRELLETINADLGGDGVPPLVEDDAPPARVAV